MNKTIPKSAYLEVNQENFEFYRASLILVHSALQFSTHMNSQFSDLFLQRKKFSEHEVQLMERVKQLESSEFRRFIGKLAEELEVIETELLN